ncbi:hypothetical protein [Adhaeribacter radiodurans]|nr:hypothetical protein [Adhaeribacter radiodurans]
MKSTSSGSISSFAIKNPKVGMLRFQKNTDDDYSIVRIKFY